MLSQTTEVLSSKSCIVKVKFPFDPIAYHLPDFILIFFLLWHMWSSHTSPLTTPQTD